MTIDPIGVIYSLHHQNVFKHDPIGVEYSTDAKFFMGITLLQDFSMLQIVPK